MEGKNKQVLWLIRKMALLVYWTVFQSILESANVANFLAQLYAEGYKYSSINSYRSAISSVHEKVDGHNVGQYPLVSRLLKGIFHDRPPLPRYTNTWNVQTVLNYLENLGENQSLSLKELSWKLTMLLALHDQQICLTWTWQKGYINQMVYVFNLMC